MNLASFIFPSDSFIDGIIFDLGIYELSGWQDAPTEKSKVNFDCVVRNLHGLRYHISASFEEGIVDLSRRQVSQVFIAHISPTYRDTLALTDEQ